MNFLESRSALPSESLRSLLDIYVKSDLNSTALVLEVEFKFEFKFEFQVPSSESGVRSLEWNGWSIL